MSFISRILDNRRLVRAYFALWITIIGLTMILTGFSISLNNVLVFIIVVLGFATAAKVYQRFP
jgi:hypothetical protein